MVVERRDLGEPAILVHLNLGSESEPENPHEFEELVLSAGGRPVALLTGSRSVPHAKYFLGTGKLAELRERVDDEGSELVIFNHTLSPGQESNLEIALNCRVIDRTGLILDIFAQRAKTHEGKLQVELAQLQRIAARLVRSRSGLNRQKGGIGLRGPGETRLETDRRLVRSRIKAIQQALLKVRSQREQNRRSRQRAEIPTVSLVGYTNAGKSSLFNAMTQADVYASDQLFATLDPVLRRIQVPDIGAAVIADTVGFISHLPHQLVDAFRATLEEVSSAALLVHVVDASSDDRDLKVERVNAVLAEIGAAELPVLRVFNKIDLLDDATPRIERDDARRPMAVWLSSRTGAGLPLLKAAIAEILGNDIVHASYHLAPEQGRLRALLYQASAVVSERAGAKGGTIVEVRIAAVTLHGLLKRQGLSLVPDAVD